MKIDCLKVLQICIVRLLFFYIRVYVMASVCAC